jgi:hypothetical protein
MFPSIGIKHSNEFLFVWYLISINFPPTKEKGYYTTPYEG